MSILNESDCVVTKLKMRGHNLCYWKTNYYCRSLNDILAIVEEIKKEFRDASEFEIHTDGTLRISFVTEQKIPRSYQRF